MINKSPVALQLRYLQTLTHIAAEKNSTIGTVNTITKIFDLFVFSTYLVFPIPIELLRTLPGAKQ